MSRQVHPRAAPGEVVFASPHSRAANLYHSGKPKIKLATASPKARTTVHLPKSAHSVAPKRTMEKSRAPRSRDRAESKYPGLREDCAALPFGHTTLEPNENKLSHRYRCKQYGGSARLTPGQPGTWMKSKRERAFASFFYFLISTL